MPHTLDATTVRVWCALALEALGQAREGIDAINVYPVADGDTGTNLYLTVESAARAVDAVFAAHAAVADEGGPALADAVRAMAHGALIGAQGNSGTILAQLLRGMAEVLSGAPGEFAAVPASPVSGTASHAPGSGAGSPGTGYSGPAAGLLARALRRAAESAYQAVAHPVEGTVLTVAMAAAEAAEAAAESAEGAALVARAAYDGARVALDATPGQLAVLGRAGVVDAGGCGLVALLDALVEAVSGTSPKEPVASLATSFPAGSGPADTGRPVRPSSPPAATEPRPGTSRTTRPEGRVPAPAAPPGPRSAAPSRSTTGEPRLPADPADASGTAPSYGRRAYHDAHVHGTAVDGDAGRAPASALPGADGVAAADPPAAERDVCAAPLAGCAAGPNPSTVSGPESGGGAHQEPAYEVIYLLEADDRAVAVLRERLDTLGDSLVVVGGEGLWNVHVHVDDAGAAVEAGIHAGRPYRIRITHFGAAQLTRAAQSVGGDTAAPQTHGERVARVVVAVVPGKGLAEIYREAGAHVVIACPGEPPASGELVEAIRRAHALEVVLLPNDAALRHTAAAAAEQARAEGVRVALIPTRSSVQGIAALAVHEPGRRFDEDVVAMTSAAGATRYAELAVAERQSWTTAGVCEAGAVLGLIDGDVAVIGDDLAATAVTVLDRMLAAGGEMVTLVLGSGTPDDLGERLERHVREGHLAVDTVLYWGGQPSVPLLIGVE